MPANVKTYLTVIVLSCLIWVFAEHQVVQEITADVVVEIQSGRPDIVVDIVSISGNAVSATKSVPVSLTVSGPGGRLHAVEVSLQSERFPFVLADMLPADASTGSVELKTFHIVNDLFRKEMNYKDTYLRVLRSDPETVTVQVTRLAPTLAPVRVISADGLELRGANVDPPQVQVFAAPGATPVAEVRLNANQQLQALKEPLALTCKVEYPDPTQSYDVRVKLPEQAGTYQDADIRNPRLGYLFPPGMAGRYNVVVEDDSILKDPIKVHGAPAAIETYRASRYHLVLEIDAQDQPGEILNRPVSYYVPPALAGELEILQTSTLVVAFRLIPREQPPAAATEVTPPSE